MDTKYTPFEQGLIDFQNGVEGSAINLSGKATPLSIYNLIISKRDLQLWQGGMKPHRHWKVTDVKKYFGIKGNKDKLVEELEKIYTIYFSK